MKNISKQIEQIAMKISIGEDPKKLIKDIKVSEREKYVLSGRATKVLLLMVMELYNVISMSSVFPEEDIE